MGWLLRQVIQRGGRDIVLVCVVGTIPLILTSPSHAQDIQTCFRPEGPSCEALIVTMINAATKTLDISWYNDTNRAIGVATIAAVRHGVAVREIVDKISEGQPNEQISAVAQAGAAVHVDCGVAAHHTKSIVVDGMAVGVGSFNASEAAERHNDEAWIVVIDANIAARFEQHFAVGWVRSMPYAGGNGCPHVLFQNDLR